LLINEWKNQDKEADGVVDTRITDYGSAPEGHDVSHGEQQDHGVHTQEPPGDALVVHTQHARCNVLIVGVKTRDEEEREHDLQEPFCIRDIL
jgi:hypothetical protein